MDKYNLQRFLDAQNQDDMYLNALNEIKCGKKVSHWIWYVFPQHVALGRSPMNIRYGITSSKEAKAYIENDILRERLLTICEALYEIKGRDLVSIVGEIDALKIRSCCTLFDAVAPEYTIFKMIIKKYCRSLPCYRTLGLLEREEE